MWRVVGGVGPDGVAGGVAGATIKAGELWSGMPAVLVSKVEPSLIEFYLEKCEETVKVRSPPCRVPCVSRGVCRL